jgi:hypothetical protein
MEEESYNEEYPLQAAVDESLSYLHKDGEQSLVVASEPAHQAAQLDVKANEDSTAQDLLSSVFSVSQADLPDGTDRAASATHKELEVPHEPKRSGKKVTPLPLHLTNREDTPMQYIEIDPAFLDVFSPKSNLQGVTLSLTPETLAASKATVVKRKRLRCCMLL